MPLRQRLIFASTNNHSDEKGSDGVVVSTSGKKDGICHSVGVQRCGFGLLDTFSTPDNAWNPSLNPSLSRRLFVFCLRALYLLYS